MPAHSHSRRETGDGLETQLAVNWLSAFMLTGLLLPLLKNAPGARVISVSSGSHYAGKMHWKDPGFRHGYHGLKAYNQSKLALVLFTYELARRLGSPSSIVCHTVDPGLVRTEIGLKGNGGIVKSIWKFRTRNGIDPAEAAMSVAYLANDPSVDGKTAGYWKEREQLESSKASHNQDDARRLWELGQALSGVTYLFDSAVS
jgi:retinol dehydrogenase 12